MNKRKKTKATVERVQLPANLYTYSEAGKLLRLSVRTLQKQVKAGTLRCERIGHRVYFTHTQLYDFVESCRRGEWIRKN